MKLKIILFILLFTLPALAQSIEPDKLREAFRRGNYDALLSLLQEAEGGNLTEFTPVFGEFLRGELESEEMSFSDVSLMSEFTADIALRMIQASPQEQGAREMEKEFLSVLAQAPERSPLGSLYTCEALRELEHQESAARRTEVLDGLLDLFPVATVSYNVTLFGLEKEDTPEAREDLVEELKRDGFSPRLMTVLRRMETERSERLAYASRSLESSDDRGRYVISEELLKESSLSPELISYFRERAHLEKNRELALLAILNLVKHDEKNPPSEELLALLRSGQLGGNSLKKAGEVLRELPEEKLPLFVEHFEEILAEPNSTAEVIRILTAIGPAAHSTLETVLSHANDQNSGVVLAMAPYLEAVGESERLPAFWRGCLKSPFGEIKARSIAYLWEQSSSKAELESTIQEMIAEGSADLYLLNSDPEMGVALPPGHPVRRYVWQQYAAKPGLSGATLGSLAYATISEKDLSLADLEALYRQSDGRTRVTFLRGLPVGEFEGQLEFLKEYSALSEPAHLTASYRHWTESREPSLLVRSLVDAYEQRDKLAEEQVREVAEVFNSLIEDWKADPSDLLAARNILLKWADELSEPTRSEIRSLLEI